jgi:hypothetical protein
MGIKAALFSMPLRPVLENLWHERPCFEVFQGIKKTTFMTNINQQYFMLSAVSVFIFMIMIKLN